MPTFVLPSDELIDELFTYHAPDAEQIEALKQLRDAAKTYARAIDKHCPPSADRTAAMRQLQDSNMTANRAVVLRGQSYR